MRPFPDGAEERFKGFADKFSFCGEPYEADVILGQPDIETVKRCKNLKWLQITSAGADGYAACPDAFNGIRLTTVSGAFGQSIAEWTLTLTLALYKNLHLFRDNQNRAIWQDVGAQDSPVGKNVLILGCGDLGSSIARIFRPFHCHIEGIRRHAAADIPDGFDEVYTVDALDERLSRADIAVGVLPGTKETKGLLSRRRLSLMNKDAVVINAGRGSLIDLSALYDMLKEGRLRGAALDVTDPEPLPKDHPLWTLPNCIITPHVSGGSFGHLRATEEKIYEICRENLRRFLASEPLLNELDFESGYRSIRNRY